MKRSFILSILSLFTLLTFSQPIAQWRGIDRKGVYDEKNLLKSWPVSGPELLWSLPDIGNGFGSPAVTSDRIYITGEKDTTGYLFVFDLQGKLLWKSDYGKEWVKTFPGSRSTPTVVGDLIYVCSGLGNLICFDAKTGTKKWTVEMNRDLHGQFPMHGHSESPVIDGDKVFLVPGGKDTNIVALNRFTGKIVWICKGRGERPAYNSPLLIRLPERNILITFTAYALFGIDSKTGEVLWIHEQDNTPLDKRQPGYGDTHSNTVYYDNGVIYYIAGDGNGAVKLELSKDGKQINQVWRNQDVDNYMGGFIKTGDYLYSCVSERKNLITMNSNTGQIVDSLKAGTGAIISADGLLYYYNQKGEMKLMRPGPGKPEMISSFKITAGTKEHFSHPVISNGVLYIRHGIALMAYDIRKK
jgi:outer membrane protein assembly factor BamB